MAFLHGIIVAAFQVRRVGKVACGMWLLGGGAGGAGGFAKLGSGWVEEESASSTQPAKVVNPRRKCGGLCARTCLTRRFLHKQPAEGGR